MGTLSLLDSVKADVRKVVFAAAHPSTEIIRIYRSRDKDWKSTVALCPIESIEENMMRLYSEIHGFDISVSATSTSSAKTVS